MTSVTSLGVTNYITQLRTCHDFFNLCKQLAKWLRKSFFFTFLLLVDTLQSSKAACFQAKFLGLRKEHVLGLVTGASGVSQALDLDHPPPSPTLLVERLQIYSHIFQLTFLVIPVTVHHHHCLNQGHFLLLHFKTVFPFYFFILRSLHSGIWKGQRLFREVLELYSAIAELSKTFAIHQFKNNLGIGSLL